LRPARNRVNSLSFSVKDDTKARTEAIATSQTRDAHSAGRRARVALNVKLGKVLKATTVSQERPIPIRMGRAMAMSAKRFNTGRAGRGHGAGTVSLTFEIE